MEKITGSRLHMYVIGDLQKAYDQHAASFAGIPEMIMEAWEIESLSDEELLDMARKEHINLRKYEQ